MSPIPITRFELSAQDSAIGYALDDAKKPSFNMDEKLQDLMTMLRNTLIDMEDRKPAPQAGAAEMLALKLEKWQRMLRECEGKGPVPVRRDESRFYERRMWAHRE
jgi:hypothetical protein